MNFERKCNRPPERAGAMPTMHDRTDADVAASDPMRASIEQLFINMSRWLHNTYSVCPSALAELLQFGAQSPRGIDSVLEISNPSRNYVHLIK